MRDLHHWPALVAAAVLTSAPAAAQHEQHAPSAQPPPPAAQHSEHAVPPAPTSVTEAERAAAFPDLGDMRMSDMMLENPLNKLVSLDRLEWHDAPGNPSTWDLDAWIGRDLTKLWIRTEGERRNGETERADVEILFGRSFARWWDFVAGARHDFEPSEGQSWAAVGVRGTAPYGFEIDATAYAGDSNRAALRFETRRDVLVTNRWILEPRLALNWYSEADPARFRGPGLSDAELALRLRYEIRREVAPYVGVARERSFGRTADAVRALGRDDHDTRWVAGFRLWF
jgi:copper resistance protein B